MSQGKEVWSSPIARGFLLIRNFTNSHPKLPEDQSELLRIAVSPHTAPQLHSSAPIAGAPLNLKNPLPQCTGGGSGISIRMGSGPNHQHPPHLQGLWRLNKECSY